MCCILVTQQSAEVLSLVLLSNVYRYCSLLSGRRRVAHNLLSPISFNLWQTLLLKSSNAARGCIICCFYIYTSAGNSVMNSAKYIWIRVASAISISPSPLVSAKARACSESGSVSAICLWIAVTSRIVTLPSRFASPSRTSGVPVARTESLT